MQLNKNKYILIIFLIFTVILTFSAGFLAGNIIYTPIRSSILNIQSEIIDEEQLKALNQVWEIIHNQFLNQPVDEDNLIRGAIRGMTESLDDPYSSYMSPEEYRSQNAPLKGEYTGIGAWVDTSGELLVILSPMPDSPAEIAGIKPGDEVVAIDGKDMTVLQPAQVLEQILGPAGTKIIISIKREGVEEVLEFELERAVIPIPSVESEVLDGNIGYIRLYTFGDQSTREFKQALNKLIDQQVMGIIFDLRNNTGGYVNTAIEITSLFIPDGVVMIEEWGDGSRKQYETIGNPLDTSTPMVILVNEGTASSSEITAGALQDFKRATLIGSSTFGKGFIQNWVPLRNENGALRITIARWLTPKGRQIEEFGLTPDIAVKITDRDILENNDAQLNRALFYLSNLKN